MNDDRDLQPDEERFETETGQRPGDAGELDDDDLENVAGGWDNDDTGPG
jgi:hypothetical protein